MEPPPPPLQANAVGGRCKCACPCCDPASPSTMWQRTVKRKLDPVEGGKHKDASALALGQMEVGTARVEVENEVAALREAVASQQQSIQDLYVELDEERAAASTAASEAMSMILRLQREKAEIQMEARQFKRFAEERMAHDQQELFAIDDLLYKRDNAFQSLVLQLQAYKHRLASLGIGDPELDPALALLPAEYDYPSLRCTVPGWDVDPEEDLDRFPFEETPRTREEELQILEQRIHQLERTPGSGQDNGMEKGVVVVPSPDGYGSGSDSSLIVVRDTKMEAEAEEGKEFLGPVDHASDDGEDDGMSDRVYTIDAVHGAPSIGVCEDYGCKLGDVEVMDGVKEDDTDIKKLYMRLQALEADRESMKQAIISMRTEKAQLALLREIAQHLCKEVSPEKRIVKKSSPAVRFSITAVIKWIMSFVLWRKKASRSKYTFGLSNNNVGLLLLLDKSPRMSQLRSLAKTQR